MTARALRPRLDDILESIDIATRAVAGRDLASFTADPVLRFAIERAIEIISEGDQAGSGRRSRPVTDGMTA